MLPEGMFKVKEIAELLEVSEQSVKRWFKDKIITYKNTKFVDFGIFVDFLFDYQNGKYCNKIFKKCEITDNFDENEAVRLVLQYIFYKCRMFVDVTSLDEEDDETIKVIKNNPLEATIVFM